MRLFDVIPYCKVLTTKGKDAFAFACVLSFLVHNA